MLEREVDGRATRASQRVAPVLQLFAPLIEREPGVGGVDLKPLGDDVSVQSVRCTGMHASLEMLAAEQTDLVGCRCRVTAAGNRRL